MWAQAVFRSMSSTQYWRTSVCGRGLLVTVCTLDLPSKFMPVNARQAKGYADLSTRSFLHLLHATKPSLPVFALVDYDPDGVNILRCYREGSEGLRHETAAYNTAIQWLGIKSEAILGLAVTKNTLGSSNSSQDHGVGRDKSALSSPKLVSSTDCQEPISHLSFRDRKLASSTLERLMSRARDSETNKMMRELQFMMVLGVKAEIQWLDEAGDISDWLDREMLRALSQSEDDVLG